MFGGFFVYWANVVQIITTGDNMFTTIIRTAMLYVLLIFAMRVMGKRQIGDMQPSELVVTLLISEIAAIPIQDTSQPIMSAAVAIFAIVSLEIILTVLSLKSNFVNNLTNGKSAIVVKNGVVQQSKMRKLRLTVADLVEMLRQAGIFDISEVAYAVLETNGTLSVMQKSNFRTVQLGDIKENPTYSEHFPSLVVSDGKYMARGISEIGATREKIDKILHRKNLTVRDVFIMTLDEADNFTVIERKNV